MVMTEEEHDNAGGVYVGERLRAIRRQKRLSLQDVEAMSGQEFKASVLGAYERGERAISVPRLLRLAHVYGVPAEQLLPRAEDIDLTEPRRIDLSQGFTLDLVRLREADGDEVRFIARYVDRVALARQDFNGRVMTIRSDDLRILAWALGSSPEELANRLDTMGLRAMAV